MDRAFWCGCAIVLARLLGGAGPATAQTRPHVDVLLVLAADVSRSIDQPKFELQRRGYAAALEDPRVLQAIVSNPDRRIAVAFVEWAGSQAQKLVVDWTVVGSGAEPAPRPGRAGRGGAALLHGPDRDRVRDRVQRRHDGRGPVRGHPQGDRHFG